jgi:hypothetical protein
LPEKVRVQRSLVEHALADPVASGNLPRPLVITPRIAEQHVGERRVAHRPEVDEPHGQRHGNDHDRLPAEALGRQLFPVSTAGGP